VILQVVLYGCESWSLTLREENRLGVFKNRVLTRYLNLEGRKTDHVESCVMMNFITCIPHRILLE